LSRLDSIWAAVSGALIVALVLVWPTEYVDNRPMCSGVPKLTYPHRNTCYGDEVPTEWFLTHPSALGLVMLAVLVGVTLAWVILRSRRGQRVTLRNAD
jgi:hypothetical protein